jgi:hypothetical protein
MELSVDVTADNDRSSDWDDIGLFSENFLGLRRVRDTFSQSPFTSA